MESEVVDILAYLQRFQEEYGGHDYMRPARDARDDLIDNLCAQLAGTEAQLAEAREALDALRAAQASVERTDTGGASSSWSVPDPEMASLWEQLAAATARAEEMARDLSARFDELQCHAPTRNIEARRQLQEKGIERVLDIKPLHIE
ncbi:hypothetical protein Taro_001885 [Colocasia esculenta]|uniref:Uncharacterized protein n=1 Tax=Colocasia esculenta TaxID=4460 RepID=A0A843TEZ9_COLES|nr:hypothetical protein [Colocasia esculenta]